MIYTARSAFILQRRYWCADVAELADALDSKSGIREDVWVRPPPSAPIAAKRHKLGYIRPLMNGALKFLVFIGCIIVAALLLLFIGTAHKAGRAQYALAASNAPAVTAPLARATPDARLASARIVPGRPATGSPNSAETMEGDAQQVITDWETRIDGVVEDALSDDKTKAEQLLALFPHLPPAGQEAAAQHLTVLVQDEDYAPLAAMLTNSATAFPVLDALMSDILNRPSGIKYPAILAVARDPKHPNAAEAHDLLELQLDNDYGQDWAAWERRLEQFLREEAAQEAAQAPPNQ